MNALSRAHNVVFRKGKNLPKKKQAHSWLPGEELRVRRIFDDQYLVVVHPVEAKNIPLNGKIIRTAKPESKNHFVPHTYGSLRRAIDKISDSWDLRMAMTEEDRVFFDKAKEKLEQRHRLTGLERSALSRDVLAKLDRYERARTHERRVVRRLLEGVPSLRDRTGRENRPAMAMKLLHVDPHLERQLQSDLVSQDANRKRALFFTRLTDLINQQLQVIYDICWSDEWRMLQDRLVEELDKLPFSPFCYPSAIIKNEIKQGTLIPARAVMYFEAELAMMDFDDALSGLRDKKITRDRVSFAKLLEDLYLIDSGPYFRLASWINALLESDAPINAIKQRMHERVDINDPGTWEWLDADILRSFSFETGKLLEV